MIRRHVITKGLAGVNDEIRENETERFFYNFV